MKKILFVICCALMMTGCSAFSISTKPVDKPALNLAELDALALDKFEFIILTRENVEKVFKQLEAAGQKPVIVGLSGTDFKVLILDLDQLKNYIAMQKEIIKKYKDYYESVAKNG